MKIPVFLSICGRQIYLDQEPDTLELVTEGVLEATDNGWVLTYAESELTGMQGVNTTFRVAGDTVTLERTGKLNSQMVFTEGVSHDSLYKVDFGALMITVCATRVEANITENGGTIDLVYNISIEQTAAGIIEYHLDIKTK